MDDLKVTDADREAAERAWPMMSIAKVAEVFAEVRAAGVAQERERWAAIVQQETGYQAGVAAERERCAASMNKMAEHWRALLAQYQSAEYPIHAHIEMAAAQAQTYEAVAAAIRAGEVRG